MHFFRNIYTFFFFVIEYSIKWFLDQSNWIGRISFKHKSYEASLKSIIGYHNFN